ncbi:MAG: peptide-methionine (S)-S-oxide reductase MsrA [Bacteroidota bacterium]|nr:peptide-methionine (S)-S-oxide reductase MsrA [Bacteroidota bacterium]
MKPLFSFIIITILLVGFVACEQKTSKQKNAHTATLSKEELSKYSQATFSGGCFWCEEAVFESVKGVKEAVSGYSGGTEPNPTYEQVGRGSTGHAETVNVYYDPTEVSYPTLLKVYFGSEDPTQVNGQGPDRGEQYRSIIFYRNSLEKKEAEDYINQLNASKKFDAPIAAQVVPFVKFWQAEDYHQNYIANNPYVPYVVMESLPRIKRFQKQFPELIKPDHKY